MPQIMHDKDQQELVCMRPDEYQALLSDYAARHAALREAVAWERECEQLDFWGVAYALCRRHPGNYIDTVRADFYAIRDSARAEVDRLLQEPPC